MMRAAILAVILAGTGCAGVGAVPGIERPTITARADLRPPCAGAVVTVDVHDPTPCDVIPPQRLDLTGATPEECADAGGVLTPNACEDVDY